MTAYHQMFVRTTKSNRELIQDLSLVTGAEISANQKASSAIAYFGRVGNTVIEVELEHVFEEDHGMNFGAYSVLVTIRELNAERSEEARVARDVFEKLKSIGDYELLLVFNLQTLVARCPPQEYDVVQLRRALPEHELPAGCTGTVVMDYSIHSGGVGRPAYEVEFTDAGGATKALVTVAEDDLEVTWRSPQEDSTDLG